MELRGHRRLRGNAKRRSRAGSTLVDVLIASVILTVAVGALVQAMIKADDLAEATEEQQIAIAAAREMAEKIQAETFPEIFRRFNSDPDDDPGGAGTAAGACFAVNGLTAREGDGDGQVGAILFPTISLGGTAVALREDVNNLALVMPRDLNGDENVDGLDHAGDYTLLPVAIRVEWTGVVGNCSTELHLLLADGG